MLFVVHRLGALSQDYKGPAFKFQVMAATILQNTLESNSALTCAQMIAKNLRITNVISE